MSDDAPVWTSLGGPMRMTGAFLNGHYIPMMTDQIKPALTAEEWATFQWAMSSTPGYPTYWIEGELELDRREPDKAFSYLALCNAALPDDDPRKLKAADLQLLRDVRDAELYTDADYEADYYTGQPFHSDETRDALSTLIAKLEALLPPR